MISYHLYINGYYNPLYNPTNQVFFSWLTYSFLYSQVFLGSENLVSTKHLDLFNAGEQLPVANPRCSMYGLFTYIWVVLGVNVGKYTIHWASGNVFAAKTQLMNRGAHQKKSRLVGGWTNPFEKYARQIGSFRRMKIKNVWNHHLEDLFQFRPVFCCLWTQKAQSSLTKNESEPHQFENGLLGLRFGFFSFGGGLVWISSFKVPCCISGVFFLFLFLWDHLSCFFTGLGIEVHGWPHKVNVWVGKSVWCCS